MKRSVVFSSKCWRDGPGGRYIIRFEEEFVNQADICRLYQGSLVYKLSRLSSEILDLIPSKRLRRNVKKLDNRLRGLFSKTYAKIADYDTVILFLGQSYEIDIVNALPYDDMNIIIYIGDPWQPVLDKLGKAMTEYNTDIVFSPFKKSAKILREYGLKVHFLPQAIDPSVWNTYDSGKERLFIQFGRKNPTLNEIINNRFSKDDYLDSFVPGDINLAKEINKSMFCVVAPKKLQAPEITGEISPVTLRYLQAMACKSLPVGFKPSEFDDVFTDNPYFVSYENKSQFLKELDYLLNSTDEYARMIEENYKIVMKNHTWSQRVSGMINKLDQVKMDNSI
jgi:glycosyltransferase involved in cell wall biosynthesis